MTYSQWQTFDFLQRNCKKLVVTIGESWTWGDSLGQTRHPDYDNKQFRLSHVYGRQLADMLDADFLNIAEPGQSNLWIAQHFQLFLNNLTEFLYDEIIVVLTLTEVGREFNGDRDQDRNYHADLKNVSNLNEFLLALSSYITKDILNVKQHDIKLLIGTNFVDSNYSHQLPVLKKSWVDIISQELQLPIAKPCYVVGSWVFDRFDALLEFCPNYKKENFLQDMLTHMNMASQVTDFLLASQFNYKKASKHPTTEGHTLWANYLHNQLKAQYE